MYAARKQFSKITFGTKILMKIVGLEIRLRKRKKYTLVLTGNRCIRTVIVIRLYSRRSSTTNRSISIGKTSTETAAKNTLYPLNPLPGHLLYSLWTFTGSEVMNWTRQTMRLIFYFFSVIPYYFFTRKTSAVDWPVHFIFLRTIGLRMILYYVHIKIISSITKSGPKIKSQPSYVYALPKRV
jgi:hypothetical protein